MPIMSPDHIAAALQRKPDAAELTQLAHACQQALEATRARIATEFEFTARKTAYAEAVLQGSAALAKLEETEKGLWRQIDHLNALHARTYEMLEAAATEKLRSELPGALRSLPTSLERTRRTLKALDAAIAENNALFEVIAQHERAGRREPPLSDAELAEWLAVRDAVWQTRMLHTLAPPGGEEGALSHPLSWPLAYEWDGAKSAWHVRPPPQRVWLPDIGAPI